MDPRTPVLVGVAQIAARENDNEPIDLMCRSIAAAVADAGGTDVLGRVQSMRVMRGVWPYRDPGTLIVDRLGISVRETTINTIGGNEAYDLLTQTAADIAAGALDVAVICAAETMRTRRRLKAGGGKQVYLEEPESAASSTAFGDDARKFAASAAFASGVADPVNYYALVESAIRHRRGETVDEHRERIAALWARASSVAVDNPDAWLRDPKSAQDIAQPSADNRMVAAPYPKLMTSNINVDMGAAVVLCSAEAAEAAGISRDRWVFPWAGTGAGDTWVAETRWAVDASPAMRIAGRRALELAEVDPATVSLLDLYSCFPAAVQVAQAEIGIDPQRSFTITGGMTFAGGPFNSYCLHTLVTAANKLREAPKEQAFLTGNGGLFTKHSFAVLGGEPSAHPYRHEQPQAAVDAEPKRPETDVVPSTGELEGYTVTFDRDGGPDKAIASVLDETGARTWVNCSDSDTTAALLASDCVSAEVEVKAAEPVPQFQLS